MIEGDERKGFIKRTKRQKKRTRRKREERRRERGEERVHSTTSPSRRVEHLKRGKEENDSQRERNQTIL